MANLLTFTKKNKENIIFFLIFLLLPWFFFNDSLKISSVIFGNGDPNNYTLPLWDLVIKSIKSGEFPFWNRYIFSGFPLFANIQSNITYPFTLLFGLIFPIHIAYNLTILLHYSLAGIFTYLFLAQYKLEKLACFAGGLIFMFSGLLMMHRGHVQMLLTVIWAPIILYFLNKFRFTKRYENVLIAAIFLSVSFFAGNPQLFFYSCMLIFLFILYYSVINLKKEYYFLLSLTVFLISFLIILFQLIPVYELSKLSLRDYLEYGSFAQFSSPRKMVLALFFPFIYGSGPSGVNFLEPLPFIEIAAYFGITAIPLLIFGFFSKNKDKYFWIFILIFSFLLVLGLNTPIYKVMFHVPLYNKFRIPTRNWFEFGLAFSVISAFGFDYYIKNFDKRFKKIVIGIIGFFSALLIGSLLIKEVIKKISFTVLIDKITFVRENLTSLMETTSLNNKAILVPVIFIVLILSILVLSIFKKNKYISIFLILIIFLDLRFFGNFVEPFSDASYIYKDIKKIEEYSFINNEKEPFRVYPVVIAPFGGASLYPNRNIHYEVESYGGYDALIYSLYNWYTGIGQMDKKEQAQKLLKNNNILSIHNTKYIMYYEIDDLEKFMSDISKVYYEKNEEIPNESKVLKFENYKVVSDTGIVILENTNVCPRFYFAENIISVNNFTEEANILNESGSALISERFDPKDCVIIENPDFTSRKFDNKTGDLEIMKYSNNEIILKTVSPSDQFLVFSDTYYPGWKAYIDGNETKIYKANGLVKGINVPEGSHLIKFVFRPANFWIYFAISLFTLISVIITAIILYFFNFKKKKLNY